MKNKYAKLAILTLGLGLFLASCKCKTCTKSGENDVKVCRDNYSSDEDYNNAIGFYQLDDYSCN
jgi:hypothetical protein